MPEALFLYFWLVGTQVQTGENSVQTAYIILCYINVTVFVPTFLGPVHHPQLLPG